MGAAFLLAALLLPDCLCGHPCAYHLTGIGHCSRRIGWRRRHCLCQHYESG